MLYSLISIHSCGCGPHCPQNYKANADLWQLPEAVFHYKNVRATVALMHTYCLLQLLMGLNLTIAHGAFTTKIVIDALHCLRPHVPILILLEEWRQQIGLGSLCLHKPTVISGRISQDKSSKSGDCLKHFRNLVKQKASIKKKKRWQVI